MSTDLPESVQACLAALSDNTRTLMCEPQSTVVPPGRALDSAAARAAMQLAAELASADGPLELQGTLGEGGMGIVRLGVQRSLHRKVAVKTLRPEHRTPEATTVLLQEAWVTGALEHPNVMPIYDVRLDEEGHPQILLKRIEGVEWTELMDDPVAVQQRYGAESLLDHNLGILMRVCHTVHFAHSRGIVHRDLKPENVMIGEFGEVYLVDWGIAVSMRDDGSGHLPLASEATDPAGTPGYMAPEMLGVQLGPITPQTDVYLLGSLLYEVLSGRPPHVGGNPAAVISSILVSEPSLPDDVPAELAAIIRRAMASNPLDRYADAEQVRLALLDYRQHRGSAQLCAEAERRLEQLVDARGDGQDEIGRGALYDLYGGCRFGFREALEMWPGNQAARQGLERSVVTMIEYELGRGGAQAAAGLLAELEQPPEPLRAEVEQALQKQEQERRRLLALEQLGEHFDAGVGQRTRWRIGAGLGVLWTLIPASVAQFIAPGAESHTPAIVTAVSMLVLIALVALVARDWLTKTAFNRRVMAAIALANFGQLMVSLSAVSLGLSLHGGRVLTILVWALVAAMMTITIDRRLLPLTLGYFATCAWGIWGADRAQQVLYAMSAGHVVATANVLAVWWPRKRAESQRFLSRGGGI